VIARETLDPFFARCVFGELTVAENALHIINVLPFVEMWLCDFTFSRRFI
jgi:hypothetical protein